MTISTSLAKHRESFPDAAEREGEGLDSAKELWAALTLSTIEQQIYRLAERQELPSAAAPRSESDGKLTFGHAQLDASNTESDPTSGLSTHMDGAGPQHVKVTMQVDGGRLGTVHLTVMREGTAVSVLVGVADPVQRALVELELSALRQALGSAGLTVGSIRVVHPEATGIPLAQGRRAMSHQTTQSASSAYRSSRSRQQTDAEEGLDVVG